jgi:hypothetical protein
MLNGMSVVSPTMEGFRAAFRRPSLTLAEIVWRWSVGATGTVLFFYGLFEFLQTLPVSNRELLFLRSRQPYLVGQAMAHILRGSLSRAVISGILAALLLAWLWMIAGALGRIATVRYLLEYFRTRFDAVVGVSSAGEKSVYNGRPNSFGTLLRLHFLRACVVLAAILGGVGAAILGGLASPGSNPQPGVAFMFFLPLATFVVFTAWALNWFLSLAAMLAVRDGEDAIGGLAAAVALCRERTGAVFAVSSWTGLARLVLFAAATTVASFPLGLARVLPGRVVLLAIVLVTLAYFAVADWLYIARLGGYVCIAEMPEAMAISHPPTIPTAPVQASIDRDEPILSDVPGLIVEA